MKLKNIITAVRDVEPDVDEQILCSYIGNLESRIEKEIISRNLSTEPKKYSVPNDLDKELLLGSDNEELYLSYITAMLFLKNGETDAYNDAALKFNEQYGLFAADYRRINMPQSPIFNYWS